MASEKTEWAVILTDAAKADLRGIINWTADQFGNEQAKIYVQIIYEAFSALTEGPNIIGVKACREVSDKVYMLHAARSGKKARHIIMFQIETQTEHTVQIIRILHDSMDIERHLPSD